MATCKNLKCKRTLSSSEVEAGRGQCAVCIVKSYKWALIQAYKAKDQAEANYKTLTERNANLHAKILRLTRQEV